MCMAEQCIFWHLTSFFVDAPEPACDFLIFLSNHLYILCICLFSVVVHIVSLTFTFRDIHSHLTFSGLLFCSLFSSSFNSQYVCVCALLSHFQIHASLTSSFFCFFSRLRIASPSSLFLNPTSIFLHTFVHILLCISAPLSPTPPAFSLTYNLSSLVFHPCTSHSLSRPLSTFDSAPPPFPSHTHKPNNE